MESLAELLAWLGMGGLAGAIVALGVAAKRFGQRLGALREALEAALRDPRHADIGSLIDQIKLAEADLKSLTGVLRRLLAR